MHWIVQNNFFSQIYYKALCEQLQRLEISYSSVSVNPRLLKIEPDITPLQSRVFVMGSSSLGKIAKIRQWTPGYFDQNLDYQLYLKHYSTQMLNSNAIISTLVHAKPQWERFFIRPVYDLKTFSGNIMEKNDLITLQQKIIKSTTYIDGNQKIVIAPLQTINAEYRFWVVDGKIVTSSLYKSRQQPLLSDQVASHISGYAQKQVDIWQPNRAFVMDIADTPNGLKIIEINAINSSALYACNIEKLISAINQMKFK